MKAIRQGYLYKSAIPFAAGLFFFLQSSRMTFGHWNEPGPGLWPTCLSAVIMAVSVLLLFAERKRRSAEEEGETFTRDSRYPLYGMLSLALFILLFEKVGLALPCLAMFLFWTKGLGRERWRVALPVSIGLTAAVFVIFAWGLDIPFPEDILVARIG